MNLQKIATIVAAIVINAAVLCGLHAWTSSVDAGAAARAASVDKVVTLPVINVLPDAAQLRELHRGPAPASSSTPAAAGGQVACVVMPYYSFATPCGNGTHA